MSNAKWGGLGISWLILLLPIINKATEFALVGEANAPYFFAACWIVGAPTLLYAKFKMK